MTNAHEFCAITCAYEKTHTSSPPLVLSVGICVIMWSAIQRERLLIDSPSPEQMGVCFYKGILWTRWIHFSSSQPSIQHGDRHSAYCPLLL